MSPAAETTASYTAWEDGVTMGGGGQKCDARGEHTEEERVHGGAGNYPDSGAVSGHQAL